jgi:DNA-binding HxlR family transcriptional regulator
MEEESCRVCLCPLEGVIDVIAKKWALLIVNAIGNSGKLRFNNLMGELGCVSPKTLSDTLKDLQKEGLITRESFSEIPPRVEYSLTHDGVELRKSIMPLIEWAATRDNKNIERCASMHKRIPAHKMNNLIQ